MERTKTKIKKRIAELEREIITLEAMRKVNPDSTISLHLATNRIIVRELKIIMQ